MTNMQAAKYSQAAIIPKYSLMGPFRGHMSIKSTPFSHGSSKLSTQYMIQDHIATHYRRLLSAKAAVDTSAPKTLFSSIKFKDQQKKERLIKAVEKYKKEIQQICSPSHHNSRSGFPEQWKAANVLFHLTEEEHPASTADQFFLRKEKSTEWIRWPIPIAGDTVRGVKQGEYHRSYSAMISSRPKCDHKSFKNQASRKKSYSDPQKKTYSGDLLDKHSSSFTGVKQPFKPRLLKKSAQSFLSKYKYYEPPVKKSADHRLTPKSGQTKAENLNELYRSLEDKYMQLGPITEELYPTRRTFLPQGISEIPVSGLLSDNNYHFLYLVLSQTSEYHAAPQDLDSRRLQQEDDLKYLHFLQDLTNDLLLRGCGSSRAMEHVFQDHLQRANHGIDEVRKKILIHELKDSLGMDQKLDFSISYDGRPYDSHNIPLGGKLDRLLNAQTR
ncbi:spermatogenesis-associated protein 7 homolog [Spea bombifrons]|uniref:spermatogenesis-associated protein 7 homolog n=1 Tax=Spea bombifrons TaxID=233779 RepID=UPI0023499699|nr:spermatogenesis-associated protein 7 homolog [Spea bombifrons]